MKNCSVCKMTVAEENECPICQSTITYEPIIDCEKEKLKLNKYLFLYLLKHCWFSLACLMAVIIRLIVKQPVFNTYFALIIFCTISSILISLFERKLIKLVQWKYSLKYAVYSIYTLKLLFGIIAVIFSFIMW